MGFSRQEYWSGLPCLPPGDLPDPGIEPSPLVSPALQVASLPLCHLGSPYIHVRATWMDHSVGQGFPRKLGFQFPPQAVQWVQPQGLPDSAAGLTPQAGIIPALAAHTHCPGLWRSFHKVRVLRGPLWWPADQAQVHRPGRHSSELGTVPFLKLEGRSVCAGPAWGCDGLRRPYTQTRGQLPVLLTCYQPHLPPSGVAKASGHHKFIPPGHFGATVW